MCSESINLSHPSGEEPMENIWKGEALQSDLKGDFVLTLRASNPLRCWTKLRVVVDADWSSHTQNRLDSSVAGLHFQPEDIVLLSFIHICINSVDQSNLSRGPRYGLSVNPGSNAVREKSGDQPQHSGYLIWAILCVGPVLCKWHERKQVTAYIIKSVLGWKKLPTGIFFPHKKRRKRNEQVEPLCE